MIRVFARFHDFFGVVSPSRCAACEKGLFDAETAICPDCKRELIVFAFPRCLKCGCELPPNAANSCPSCARARRKYSFVLPVGPYLSPMRELIIAMKLRGFTILAQELGKMLADVIIEDKRIKSSELIVPVPLSALSFRNRGYNQSYLIAKVVANALKCEIAPTALRKIKETKQQDELTRLYRLTNLKGSFKADSTIVSGRSVLLIDDVVTTGATADECANTLRMAGATDVAVACIAYTLPHDVL